MQPPALCRLSAPAERAERAERAEQAEQTAPSRRRYAGSGVP